MGETSQRRAPPSQLKHQHRLRQQHRSPQQHRPPQQLHHQQQLKHQQQLLPPLLSTALTMEATLCLVHSSSRTTGTPESWPTTPLERRCCRNASWDTSLKNGRPPLSATARPSYSTLALAAGWSRDQRTPGPPELWTSGRTIGRARLSKQKT